MCVVGFTPGVEPRGSRLDSLYIAGDLDLTAKQVGDLITKLRDRETKISIEPWAYTNATTWRVTLAEG
ncbi:MAG: hypothetical protein ABEH88_03235 [Halobacteriales archaeon]